VGASERDEFLRAARREPVGGILEVRRFMFVNEMGTNTSLLSMDGPSGRRAHFQTPPTWGTNLTLVSSMNSSELGPSFAVEGSATCEVFEA
jgi:hypothetical protein